MDKKIYAAACIPLVLLVAFATASSLPSTPLYIYRMEQHSSKMHFLSSEVTEFTYTTEKGYNLHVTTSGGLPLEEPTVPFTCPDTCYDTCLNTCPYTCNTCSSTCQCTCPVTCESSCSVTCEPTCINTCEGSTCSGTCYQNTCKNTCITCDPPPCWP